MRIWLSESKPTLPWVQKRASSNPGVQLPGPQARAFLAQCAGCLWQAQEPTVKDQSGPSTSARPQHTTSLWLEKEAMFKGRVDRAPDRRRWAVTCDLVGMGRSA